MKLKYETYNHFSKKVKDFLNDTNIISYEFRPMFKYIKQNIKEKKELLGVEIGVKEGKNAYSILNNLTIKKLFLIDPYIEYDDCSMSLDKNIQNINYDIACNRLKKFIDKVDFVIKKSSDAVDFVPDGLDFVYIDGNHDYNYALSDISLYYPKVKNNGIIGGHNWNLKDVCFAVVDFCKEKDLFDDLYIGYPDWWIVKRGKKEK